MSQEHPERLQPLGTYDVAELERLRDTIELDLARIKTQLDTAKAGVMADGVYADAKWFAAAQGALRFKGREHQMILRELGGRRKSSNRAANASHERLFIQVAKRLLSEDLYNDIWAHVRDEESGA